MSKFFTFIAILFAGALSCPAQVPVSREPRHHNVFENSELRVLDVDIPPGDTSLMHEHGTPSIFIVLSHTRTGSQVIREPARIQLTPGNIWFEGFYAIHRIHRVWNSDTTDFHVMDIELLNKTPKQIDPPLNPTAFSLLFDEAQARGYRFTLASRAVTSIPARKAAILVVGLNDAAGSVTLNNKTFEKKGDFIFLPPGSAIHFTSNTNMQEDFALFELK